uniref:beta-taxilin-like n=1 Tax=Fragaria vesca subsp. vesca TaxID=101020 RepID=UPI0005CB4A0E|nr:PREDICTED: beta-taxilin-like [Fragaria vesca subsp. vesca]
MDIATEQVQEGAAEDVQEDAAEEVQEDVADQFMEIATEQVQKGAAEQVQEDATDEIMEIATEQVQEGVAEQVQEEPKYLALEDWVNTEEIENQHAKVDGKGKEMVEFNFENGGGAEGNVDEFEDAIYEQNAAETERILKKFFNQDRDGETEVFSKRMKHNKMCTPEELEQWIKQMEKEALIYNGIEYQSSEDKDVNIVEHRQDGSAIDTCTSCKRNFEYIEQLCEEKKEVTKKYKQLKAKLKKKEEHIKKLRIKCRQLWLLQKGLEGARSEKDTESEKGGAGSEKLLL